MDGDSNCDEGNDELTCVRSDESDKSSWSASRRSYLRSWFQRQGDAWRKEGLLTFREEEEGGRERITTFEERVLRWDWTEIKLYRFSWKIILKRCTRDVGEVTHNMQILHLIGTVGASPKIREILDFVTFLTVLSHPVLSCPYIFSRWKFPWVWIWDGYRTGIIPHSEGFFTIGFSNMVF